MSGEKLTRTILDGRLAAARTPPIGALNRYYVELDAYARQADDALRQIEDLLTSPEGVPPSLEEVYRIAHANRLEDGDA